jgi:hypothetical protein
MPQCFAAPMAYHFDGMALLMSPFGNVAAS